MKWGRLPDITAGTAECLQRVLQIASLNLSKREAFAHRNPECTENWKDDAAAFVQVKRALGLDPWEGYQSLIPAAPPIDRTSPASEL